ncbi:2063_t:CDS:1 [Cetraspora pellucida]|uniref:2063_t:CDS:1 n=1 Tax=Cetraspora pellucida TaxID=1433469 RepID=A0A9N8Z1U0_9GLOM|nr:2063_t:CDS:1 [Cetraspora pellucida]
MSDHIFPLINLQVVSMKKIATVPYIPPEIIRMIFGLLRDDKKTLATCALVSHTFNLHATPFLYHTVAFVFPHTFTLFANVVNDIKKRSHMVRHLDLSGFSTCGLQKSYSDFHNVVTPELLIYILRSCPELKTFSVSESLEFVITFDVLKVLFLECKNVITIDLCGFSTKQFGNTLEQFCRLIGRVRIDDCGNDLTTAFNVNDEPALSHLQRLSLHECAVISECSTIILLANAPNLTHLDLGGCSISDLTINFLAETNAPTNFRHLLLAKCKNISSCAISSLILKCSQLESLNLYGVRDTTTIINEYDLINILSSPSAKNLQILDIGSSQITPLVLTLIKENCSSSLKNLGISKAQITNISVIKDLLTSLPNLQYIDLTSVLCFNVLNTNTLLNSIVKNNHPIHTIEMNDSLLKKLYATKGWKIDVNYGRRWYYSRESRLDSIRADRVHGRKLDLTEYGPEYMSNIFQYYSFDA